MMFLLKSEKSADGSSVYTADQSFMPVFLIIAGFMLLSVLIMIFTVKENKIVSEMQDIVAKSDEENPEDKNKGKKNLTKNNLFI